MNPLNHGPLIYSSPSAALGWRALAKDKPKLWAIILLASVLVATFIPIALALRARADFNKKNPRIHIFQDMDNQPKVKAQQSSFLFADGRGNRPPVVGTVARGEANLDPHLYLGYQNDASGQPAFYNEFPEAIRIDEALLARGQKKYNIYCATCHGGAGFGDGPTHMRSLSIGVSGWVAPTSLHADSVKARELGHLYNTINNGIRNMAGYGTQIQNPEDRWAVVAYIKALQATDGVTTSTAQSAQDDGQLATGN